MATIFIEMDVLDLKSIYYHIAKIAHPKGCTNVLIIAFDIQRQLELDVPINILNRIDEFKSNINALCELTGLKLDCVCKSFDSFPSYADSLDCYAIMKMRMSFVNEALKINQFNELKDWKEHPTEFPYDFTIGGANYRLEKFDRYKLYTKNQNSTQFSEKIAIIKQINKIFV